MEPEGVEAAKTVRFSLILSGFGLFVLVQYNEKSPNAKAHAGSGTLFEATPTFGYFVTANSFISLIGCPVCQPTYPRCCLIHKSLNNTITLHAGSR
jgi:hypothetical protein